MRKSLVDYEQRTERAREQTGTDAVIDPQEKALVFLKYLFF